MALGFQDCCNSSSYFYLDGIPATVSQNEFYHIITLEGPAFCATYTTIPALNYLPPTYTLVEMTEYTSCDTCFAGAPLTCPAQETIFLSQFGPGSISLGTDCSIRTLFPMIVECISTNPTFDGFADGVVRVFVAGGTPPYTFFNLNDGTVFGGALPVQNSVYTLIDGALEGEYPIRVVDAQSDFNVTVNCVLESPPTILTVVAIPTPVSIAGACNGVIVITVNNGTPPYQIFLNGVPVSETTINELCAGDYEITVIDSGVGTDQQIASTTIAVGTPNAITYPLDICLQVTYCETLFLLTFSRVGSYNFRANYVCDNPGVLGLTQLILRWEAGWTTTQETTNGNIDFSSPCPPLASTIIQFVKTSPQTEQPTGNWQSNLGMFQGISAVITQGVCVPVDPVDPGGGGGPAPLPLLSVATTNAVCSQVLGQAILVANGGAGAPYQYLVNGILQPSSTIQLAVGTYTATVLDANNVSSVSVTFTIGSETPSNILMNISAAVDTSDPYYTQNITNSTIAGFSSLQRYGSSHPVKITASIIGLPISNNFIEGNFIIRAKKQSLFNDFFQPAMQVVNGSEILMDGLGQPGFPKSPRVVDNLEPAAFYNVPYVATNEVFTTATRPSQINTNFIPVNQSDACTPPNNVSRKSIRQMTVGPVQLSNETSLNVWIGIDNLFRTGDVNGCQHAVGVQFDIEFVQTSPNITCYNLLINGNNTTTVTQSARQLNETQYLPHIYTSTVIIDG